MSETVIALGLATVIFSTFANIKKQVNQFSARPYAQVKSCKAD